MNTIENQPRHLSHVRAMIYGEPIAMDETALEKYCAIYEAHARGESPEFQAAINPGAKKDGPGFDLQNNVAIIPVTGPIFPKANLMTRLSGATSLSDLQDTIQSTTAARPSAAILNCDSPGGSTIGLWDFCAWLSDFCAASKFPVIALVNPMAASAAYAIASQCSLVMSTSDGMSGSIGVIAKMDNTDRAQRNAGNDSVVLRSHELKGIGAGAMTPNQQADIQRIMNSHMSKFQAAVSRGRPEVDIDAVSTGQYWPGESANSDPSAQDMGLIDGISTLEKLIEKYGE